MAWVKRKMLGDLGAADHTTVSNLRFKTNAVEGSAEMGHIKALEDSAGELEQLLRLAVAPVEELPLVLYRSYKALGGRITAETLDQTLF